ncbi:phosphate starvation-inducible protein PhoH [Helicobacter sp. 16-1353]|uniref:PhoH family protein n=1 Tax=Helicobacter sp. 16-1353 TaxID=2004996 RepID=UPI000DCBBF98|nr:PhoH family protein [Helicobacter sp. 16-1353]RAX55207.1 phosphate starvation-inducible protein PhoH [Helicobacter sp. 16-1353]
MAKKKYLLDTSIVLDDIENLTYLYQNGENEIFISEVVLQELDKKKDLQNELGYFSREFFRAINSHCVVKKKNIGKIDDMVYQMNFNTRALEFPIFIIYRPKYKTQNLDYGLNDSRILEIAKDYGFHLLTNDVSLRIKAISQGIKAESIFRNRVENPSDINFLFTLNLHKDSSVVNLENNAVFQGLKDWSIIELQEEDNTDSSLYLTGKKRFGFKIDGRFEEQNLDVIIEENSPYIRPINLEQKLLYTLLIHPKNKVSIVTGSTGSGKTLISLQAGITLVKKGIVDGIVYMRNTITSNDKEAELGYRKGDESQKLGYFMYPLYSAVNFTIDKLQESSIAKQIEYSGDVNTIQKCDATEYFIKKHNIEVMDIAHARGVSIGKKFVIFDEAQNAQDSTIKLIGTRIAQDCRIVFLGDWKQIDHPYLSKFRNGAVTLLQKAQKSDFVSGIQLKNTIRSDIAQWFEENM